MRDGILALVAERDGLTQEQARVLIEMWSWPIGMAIQPAYKKAQENHPDWQEWRDGKRDEVPSFAEWRASIEKC